MMSRIV